MLLVDCIQYEAWYTKMTQKKKISPSSMKKSFGAGFDPQIFGFVARPLLYVLFVHT